MDLFAPRPSVPHHSSLFAPAPISRFHLSTTLFMSATNLTDSFVAVTGASPSLAQQYLARNNNDLEAAIEDFYDGEKNAPAAKTKPIKPASRGIRTLRDLGDDDDEEDRTNPNLFTGGEKSALQVENPDKDKQPLMVERILQRAREQMGEEDDRESAVAPPASFSGGGFKLGDLSQALQPVAGAPRAPEKVSREIVFWRQGFTVGDGPLNRYDDPANVRVLEDLRQGRVPVLILGVDFGQDVDVSVQRRTDEDYVERAPVGGFLGSGQRLGLPVPGDSASPAPEAVVPAVPAAAPAPAETGDSPVQIRFANGKRVARRFNSLDSVAEVYAFVRLHEHNDPLREFVLSHAFPVLPIAESAEQTVADAKLKNAVLVQRWK